VPTVSEPFSSPTGAVFSSRRVMHDGWPVLLVTHDADDGAWQFVNGHGDTEAGMEPMIVHVDHILELDPLIESLADLPLGWRAWRDSAEGDWTREPQP
jgi:hypothetical protein